MITLENSKLIVTAKEVGAELTRIYDKEHQRECLWTGNPEFWRQQAPTLFPVVGRCKNYEYRYKGQTYHMGQHGFVREATFEVESQTDEQVVFVYRANEETRKDYPFEFTFKITYTLKDDAVETAYTVMNESDSEPMYFSIGGHPGFLYDGPIGEQILTFSEKENIDRVLLSPAMQFSREVTKDYVKNGEPIALYDGIFVDDALVFHGFKSNKIGLLNPTTGRGVEMDLTGFPYVGIWAANKPNCPYACIEPWFGLADYDDFEGELPEKDGIEMLPANGVFNCAFSVKVL